MLRITSEEESNVLELRLRHMLLLSLDGNEEAYASFLKLVEKKLRGYFGKRLFSSPADVEDLVQVTLLALHNQRQTYDPDQRVTAWVYAIARYKLFDWLRAHGVHEARQVPIEAENEIFTSSESEAVEAHLDIKRLLVNLPDRYRLPIVHVKLEGLSVAEAASVTGMSESAIKVGIHRGLKALAIKIQGQRYEN